MWSLDGKFSMFNLVIKEASRFYLKLLYRKRGGAHQALSETLITNRVSCLFAIFLCHYHYCHETDDLGGINKLPQKGSLQSLLGSLVLEVNSDAK